MLRRATNLTVAQRFQTVRSEVCVLTGGPIFLIYPTYHDLKHIIRQWPLQRLGLIPRRAHPNVPLVVGKIVRLPRLDQARMSSSQSRHGEKALNTVHDAPLLPIKVSGRLLN
jgi:hypothetical protein